MNFPYCLLCGDGLGGQTIATTLGTFHALCYNNVKRGAKNWMEEDAMIAAAIEAKKAAKEGLSNATSTGEIRQSDQPEHSGVAPGQDVREHAEEVRKEKGKQASGSDSPVNGKGRRKKKVAERIAA